MTAEGTTRDVDHQPATESGLDQTVVSAWQSLATRSMPSRGTPRILHCAETIQGGIANYLSQLLPVQLRDFGPDSIVVVVPKSQVKFLPQLEGVKILSYRDTKSRVGNAYRLASKVRKIVSLYDVDIVHIHSTFAGTLVRPALALLRHHAKIIYCPHGWAFYRYMPRLGKLMTEMVERNLAHLCDAIVCVSEFERRSGLAIGIPAHRLRLVVNGINGERPPVVEPLPQWPPGRKRLLFVGRFDRQKGLDVFLDAMRLLGGEAHGYVAGGSVLADDQHFDIPDNVSMVGWLPPEALEGYFETADVLVMPSRWEGLPLVATEAMRAHLAVLSSAVGGIPEVVVTGETGVMLDPCDARSIADQIRRTTRDQWKAMGRAGEVRFKKLFTIERVHEQLCELYGLSRDGAHP